MVSILATTVAPPSSVQGFQVLTVWDTTVHYSDIWYIMRLYIFCELKPCTTTPHVPTRGVQCCHWVLICRIQVHLAVNTSAAELPSLVCAFGLV